MRSAADRLGIKLLVGCGVLLVLVVVVGLLLESRQEHLDPLNGCTIGAQPSAETVALIDLTDPIPQVQRDEVAEYFRQLESTELRANERLTVWTLSGAKDGALQRRFCRCHPRRTVNPLWANEQLAAAASESMFAAPLRRALADLPTQETAARTPLLEAVQQIVGQPEFAHRACPRRLVLVTNGEQNSGILSAYTGKLNFVAFRKSTMFDRVHTDLRGVDVELLHLPHGRAAITLSDELTTFWAAYFGSCGAHSVVVRRL